MILYIMCLYFSYKGRKQRYCAEKFDHVISFINYHVIYISHIYTICEREIQNTVKFRLKLYNKSH